MFALNISSSAPAIERKNTVPLHPVTRYCPMSVLPSVPSVPVRCDPDSRQSLPPSRAATGEEVDERVQMHLFHRHAPLRRPRHHRFLRQKVRTCSAVQYALKSLHWKIAPTTLPMNSFLQSSTISDTTTTNQPLSCTFPNATHRRVVWFDLDLSSTPYKTLKFHEKAVRCVQFHKYVTALSFS